MIGIKVAAIALAGLGGATVGSDVYLSARARTAVHASWQHSSEIYRPAGRASESTDSPASGSVVVLGPVTIHSRSSDGTVPAVVDAPNREPTPAAP